MTFARAYVEVSCEDELSTTHSAAEQINFDSGKMNESIPHVQLAQSNPPPGMMGMEEEGGKSGMSSVNKFSVSSVQVDNAGIQETPVFMNQSKKRDHDDIFCY